MTVGFFSPLPPARTGIADYSASLLGALRKRGPVDLSPSAATVNLYHVGNNVLHASIYERAISEPGVVVLHDATLQHLFMGMLDERRYVEEFVYNYGAWTRDLARDLWRSRTGSGLRPEFYDYPMLRRLVERARAVVVHNAAAAAVVRRHATATPVVEIPHLFDPPALPSLVESMRFRERLGIRPTATVFGIFGYLRESKRIATALRAFGRVGPGGTLLLAGDFASLDLPLSIRPLLDTPGVIRLPHLSDSNFWQAAAATDVCLNLRYPSAAETSGILIRLMGIGKTVLISAGDDHARFPAAACIPVDRGPAEEEMLSRYMLWLKSSPEAARQIGYAAAEHIRRDHSVDRVADRYWETLCAHASRS